MKKEVNYLNYLNCRKYKKILTIQTPLWYINLAVVLDKAVR